MTNTNEITNLTIDASALDFWKVADLINELSGIDVADDLMVAFEDWRDENAIAFAAKYAREGRTDDAEAIMGIYDGDIASDPEDPAYDPESPWCAVLEEIRRATATANEEPEPAPAPAAANDALREDPEYRTWDDALVWIDQMPQHKKGDYDPWQIVEEAARIHSTGAGEGNLFEAGRIYGMACAIAAICPVDGADANWWLGFIEDYAAANYANGARIEE